MLVSDSDMLLLVPSRNTSRRFFIGRRIDLVEMNGRSQGATKIFNPLFNFEAGAELLGWGQIFFDQLPDERQQCRVYD